MLSPAQVKAILLETGAIQEGHFLLSSGLHSPLYIQCALVFQHPGHAQRLGAEMNELFAGERVDVVISPAMGGIVTGQEVARARGARAIFAEREDGIMRLRRGFRIEPGERVLVVDRSGGDLGWEVDLRSLMRTEAVTYPPEQCPLCREKLPLVKPGSRKQEKP